MSEIQSTTCSETGRTFKTNEAARASELRFREIQTDYADGQVPELRPGDVIYVDTELYIGHGRDDFHGGLIEVLEFSAGNTPKTTPFVVVAKECKPAYNWKLLAASQERLRSKFSQMWAYPDPDSRPEFNEDWH